MIDNVLSSYEIENEDEKEDISEFENKLEEEYFREFINFAGHKAVILDLACGSGRHTLQLSRNAKAVIAFDLSQNNIKIAKQECFERKNIIFIEGSMFELPFPSNFFDGVWFSQAFEYVPPDKRETMLNSLNNILKPSGVLYISVETWLHPNIWISLKNLYRNFKFFAYWKFVKKKPLLWGEFLYPIGFGDNRDEYAGWHYHVHTDKWTLCRLLDKCKFMIEKINLHDGYIYVLCRKVK